MQGVRPAAGVLRSSVEEHIQADVIRLPGWVGPVVVGPPDEEEEDCNQPNPPHRCPLPNCSLFVGIVGVEGWVNGTTVSGAFFTRWCASHGGSEGG